MFEKIAEYANSKNIWNTLKKSYEGVILVKKVKLRASRRQHKLMEIKYDEKVTDYFTRLVSLTSQVKIYGVAITYEVLIEKVLRTLSIKYDHIAVTIEETKESSDIEMEELRITLEEYELKLIERNNENEEENVLLDRFKKSEADKNKWKNNKK